MATIIRCDRCGLEEDAAKERREIGALRREGAEVVFGWLGGVFMAGVWAADSVSVDLCQACRKDLKDAVLNWWSSPSSSGSSPLTTVTEG